MRIVWFWDTGVDVRLGDEMNSFKAWETVRSVDEIVPWLQEAIAHFYPRLHIRRLIEPQGERARCQEALSSAADRRFSKVPRCGSPKAYPFMDELFAFVCDHCGNSVQAQPPKTQ